MLYEETTNKIIRAFYSVYTKLGFGFLEKVYENAMIIELQKTGLCCTRQHPIKVLYEEIIIGDYYADIIVENSIILELKAVETICKEHELQLINYLKATDKEIGLLLNFGSKPQIKRKIFTNDKKRSV